MQHFLISFRKHRNLQEASEISCKSFFYVRFLFTSSQRRNLKFPATLVEWELSKPPYVLIKWSSEAR